MNSTFNGTARIGFAVLRPIEPQHDGRRFQVFFSASKWPSLDAAVKWAKDRNIDGKFVLGIESREFLESLEKDFRVEAAHTTKPHLLVFEEGERRRVIGEFASEAHGTCWSAAYFGMKRRGKTQSYETLDPDFNDPKLEDLKVENFVRPNLGKVWP